MSFIQLVAQLKILLGLRTINVWWLLVKVEKGMLILDVFKLIFILTLYFYVNRFGHVFMSETGTSVGEISGQSKPINSCDFRPSRPFRIVTGSEDNTVGVFEGPPFKFKMTKQVYFNSTLIILFNFTFIVTY